MRMEDDQRRRVNTTNKVRRVGGKMIHDAKGNISVITRMNRGRLTYLFKAGAEEKNRVCDGPLSGSNFYREARKSKSRTFLSPRKFVWRF